MRSPILAAVLSLVLSGLGQIYNGEVTKGVVFIVVQLINAALTTILIGWSLMPIVGLWTIARKYETAELSLPRPTYREGL
jgi:TM2 domain-containing membrane protein YozV